MRRMLRSMGWKLSRVCSFFIQAESKYIFLEAYTAILGCPKEDLERFYGKKITLADRLMVEQQSDTILQNAKEHDVAFLVVGDPFAATTHSDLYIRAVKDSDIKVRVYHNASIMNAIGCSGLQLYRFGETISMCFWDSETKVTSWYPKMLENKNRGLHTLCLLDIKIKEPENMERGPRFMTIHEACKQIIQVSEESKDGVISSSTKAVGLARVGQEEQMICYGTLDELRKVNFGAPLHSLILCGKIFEMEEEMLDLFKFDQNTPLFKKSNRYQKLLEAKELFDQIKIEEEQRQLENIVKSEQRLEIHGSQVIVEKSQEEIEQEGAGLLSLLGEEEESEESE